jgi:2,4-dienoyl-CoA reductase-like NADH-dependent reductase (Old Yellow Enzyme family)/thioredoxin reductase
VSVAAEPHQPKQHNEVRQMTEPFPNLFSPLRVGNYTLKNRIMNTGHAAHFQAGDGTPTEQYVHYVGERAKGGAAIIVTGHTVPVYDGEASLSLTNFDDRVNPVLQRMAAATHAYDVPLLAQLGHRGRRVADNAAFLQRDILAPSPVPSPDFSVPMFMPHELTTAEVEQLVEAFAAAFRRVRKCELDGIELSVGMDYLFANFLHPNGNRRSDRYGGSTLEERMTFLRDVISTARDELGPDRLIGVRMYDDMVDYSMQLEDYVELAKHLERDGIVSYLNMWHAIVPSPRQGRMHWPSYYYPPGAFVHLPEAIKAAVKLPVVGTGRMDSPAVAERTLAEGKADIIGMAKTLIADPHFPNKAKAGRVEDIRPCIACTQSCVGHVDVGLAIGCIYNPVVGREREWATLNPAPVSKKVLIVGAGPAGMEAARVAAMRGHTVVLIERGARMGGQINLVMKTPNRGSFEEIISWFERQLPKLGVEIRLRSEADAEMVLAENADEVIVATGSTPFLPDVKGIDRPNVWTARDVLSGRAQLGQHVLVVDTLGRAEAVTTADYLVDRGHRVHLVTGLPLVAPHMPTPARHHLLEKLMNNKVTLSTYTGVWEIGEHSLETYNVVNWEPNSVDGIDSVVFGAGGKADSTLFCALEGRHTAIHTVGDCHQPRDIEVSIIHGHRVAREL